MKGISFFYSPYISHDKIKEVIMQMKTTKSSGYDKISVKLLQAGENSIVERLTHIFNLPFRTGIIIIIII